MVITIVLAALIYFSTTYLLNSGFITPQVFYTAFTQDPKIRDILSDNQKFVLTEDADADIIIEVSDKIHVFSSGTDRSRAALYNFEQALKDYNKKVIEKYPEEDAYPLRVDLELLDREDVSLKTYFELNPEHSPETQEDSQDSVNRMTPEKEGVLEKQEGRDSQEISGEDEDLGLTDTEDTGEKSSGDEPEEEATDQSGFSLSDLVSRDKGSEDVLSLPENLNPFRQLKMLFMVILLTIPISMISVVYSNSMMSEKINKRGVFFLVSPVTKLEVVLGKTLPYLFVSYLLSLPVIISSQNTFSAILGSSLVLLSIFIIYLSIGFLCAMLSRSHRELSFLSIFFISLYTCYLLVPSFMVNISFISLASPLSIMVKLFQGEVIGLSLYIFTLVPGFVAGFALFFFASRLFNDEDMFSYRTIKEKILDALKSILSKSYWNLLLIAFFVVPFVYLIELMMIVFLMSLRSFISIYLLMIAAAFVEECFRNIGIYTIMSKKLHKQKIKHLALYSLLSGFGFFLGEKAILLIMIAPFIDAYFTLIVAGIITPLVLHTSLTFIFAVINKQLGKRAWGISVSIATLLHFLINFTISFLAMGGA